MFILSVGGTKPGMRIHEERKDELEHVAKREPRLGDDQVGRLLPPEGGRGDGDEQDRDHDRGQDVLRDMEREQLKPGERLVPTGRQGRGGKKQESQKSPPPSAQRVFPP